jgi:hypothetical protein
MRTLKIFFHDGCFDGVSSAAMFSRFYHEAIDSSATVIPVGMNHRDGDPFAEVAFNADDHACVDFRFSPAPQLRWWFDHHATAFQPPTLRGIFDDRRSATHVFDPLAPSCAGLIARTLRQSWAWHLPPHLLEVATWADRIDSLDYASAAEATALTEPAQRISVFLSTASREQTASSVTWLERRSLDEIAQLPEVETAVRKFLEERDQSIAELRRVAVHAGDLVSLDLLASPGLRAPGLLGYLLFPRCRYLVSAVASTIAVRISVGHNPWAGVAPSHHIGELCQRFGGGGHLGVGGVTLGPHEVDRGRSILHSLVRALAES